MKRSAIRKMMEMARYMGAAWKINHNGNMSYKISKAGKPKRFTAQKFYPLTQPKGGGLRDMSGQAYRRLRNGQIVKSA